jgi:hypothetical protein
VRELMQEDILRITETFDNFRRGTLEVTKVPQGNWQKCIKVPQENWQNIWKFVLKSVSLQR